MATTSFLYHAFGLQEYQILSTEYGGGETVFHPTDFKILGE